MAAYSVTFARSARKELESLDPPVIKKIILMIEGLAFDPRPSSCQKLQGNRGHWRIRVGDYRIVDTVDDMHKGSIFLEFDIESMLMIKDMKRIESISSGFSRISKL